MRPPFTPAAYVEAISDAAQERFDALVIDSLTHAWSGPGGALEMVDKAAKRSQSGNSYMAWRDVTPEHQRLIDALIRFPGHLIATMRSKTEYVIDTDSRGKQVPRRVGLAPVQRDGMEYEFGIFAELNAAHELIVQKSRMPELSDAVIPQPGEDLGARIATWLASGVAVQPERP